MSTQQMQKQHAAEAAVDYIKKTGEDGLVLGVGSGSTMHCFINALATIKSRIEVAVASSNETEKRLKAIGIPVIDLNAAGEMDLYVDGADEISTSYALLKGGGGALTREKILAAASKRFICIADISKKVRRLGVFPLPIEVIPMARSFVAREMVKLGGDPVYREDFVTDNGNIILDVHNLMIDHPIALEETINQIPGVVTNGLFALRIPEVILIAGDDGIECLHTNSD